MADADPGAAVKPGSLHALAPAADLLARARADRVVLQDFTPLCDSLEWELGQVYLRERGNKAFISDPEPVPFAVNNDGTLSVHAAEVFFVSLEVAAREGKLPAGELFVLELGIGVGLFARYFLDHFRGLCARAGKDYYDRLTYVAADRSPQMLRDAGRHGVFANHAGHYLLRVADALCPERDLLADPQIACAGPQPFRAVFLNYLLDCLPVAVLRVQGEEVRQLCVRTCVGRSAPLAEFTPLAVEELAQLAASADPEQRRELLAVYGLLAADYTFRPVDAGKVPYGDFAVRQARASKGGAVQHSHGALQCLERLLALVPEGGFVLMNDYGPTKAEEAGEDFQHQVFSHATFAGVNFPLLKAFFAEAAPGDWAEPAEDDASVHPRLLGRRLAAETTTRFRDCFGKAARDRLGEPVDRARALARHGRLEAALASYQEGLERQPYSWLLMNEVAHLLLGGLRAPAAALELARAARACNPACAADLWCTLGDCLFELGRTGEARQAYFRALRVNSEDVRARYNLAFVHVLAREYEAALVRIGEALARDRTGQYREGLLRKQSEALAHLERRHQQEFLRRADRVSAPPGRLPPREDAPKVAPAAGEGGPLPAPRGEGGEGDARRDRA